MAGMAASTPSANVVRARRVERQTSCLKHKPRNTTVTCASPDGCEVLCVSRDDFLQLVRGSWDVARDLVALSEQHSKEKERRVNFRRTRDEVSDDDDDNDYG
eukprot:CAMPEP_0195618456 /NCGR_PEP_ID=MMETSP0815-20121206/14091_1 /TAXON_ID=97485 /ORGANISM="Prymnesium parvum, Strain Texoma1" /LENGTH=101 /DNA_ID=CAMNT_0040758991 /DNA_START=104 /DNA_END=409 /DNA_ORIENTATION=+